MICFKTSIRCFSAAAARPGKKAAALDLGAPEITRIFSQEELQQKLPEEPEREVQDTVQVEGERQGPNVPGGIMSLPWAVIHPTQAWRILMPVPTAK